MVKSLLLILGVVWFAAGCTQTTSDSADADDSETDRVFVPTEVSGSYLTCAFTSSKEDVKKSLADQDKGVVDVGCGFFNDGKLAELKGLSLDWQVERKTQLYTVSTFPGGENFHVIIKIPAKIFKSRLVVTVEGPDGSAEVTYDLKAIKSYGGMVAAVSH